MPPIIDVECYPSQFGVSRETWAYQIKTSLDTLEKRYGEKPMIYTSANFWSYVAVNGSWNVNDCPLWTALYPRPATYVDSVNEPYPLPKGWVKWAMWQYAEDGRTQGYLWNDLNVVSNWFKIYLDSKWGETITPTPKKFPYSIKINDKTYKEAQ